MKKKEITYEIGRFKVTAEYTPTELPKGLGLGISGDEHGRVELRVATALLSRVPSIDGEAAKFARKAMGLRQADLAALLDVAVETVSRWETGTETVRRQTQLALLQLLESAARSETGSPTPIGSPEAQNDSSGVRVVAA